MASPLPALIRRIDRKLAIHRGMHFSADDLALLVASGGYAALAQALTEETELKCRDQLQNQESQPEWPVRKSSMRGRHLS